MSYIQERIIDRFGSIRLSIIGVFITAFFTRYLILLYSGGFRIGIDGERFIATCSSLSALAASGMSPGILSEVMSGYVGVEYIGFIFPFCGVNFLFGTPEAWGYLQLVLSAGSAVVVYLIGRRLLNPVWGTVAGLIFAIMYDSIRWTVEIRSEAFFVLILTVAIWRLVEYRDNRTHRNALYAVVATIWMSLSRPFGIPFVLVGVALLIFTHRTQVIRLQSSAATRTKILSGILISAVAIIIVLNIETYSSFSTVSLKQGWIFYSGEARPGLPIPGAISPPTVEGSSSLVQQTTYLLQLVLLKLIAFLYPANYALDPKHTIHFVNTFIYLPVLVLGFAGMRSVYKNDKHTFILLISPIVATLLITIPLFVERRFRYRAPLIPSIIIFSVYHISSTPVGQHLEKAIRYQLREVSSRLPIEVS